MIDNFGCLRQEVHFYPTCADRAQEMKTGAHTIAQEMMLISLLKTDYPRKLNGLAEELQHHVDKYTATVYKAEEECMAFMERG